MVIISVKTNAQTTIGDFQNMSVSAKTKMVTDSMQGMLNLTDTQYPLVYQLNEKSITKATAIKTSNEGRMSKRKQLKEVLEFYKSKMATILTPVQQEELKTKMQNLIGYYREKAKESPLIFNVPN